MGHPKNRHIDTVMVRWIPPPAHLLTIYLLEAYLYSDHGRNSKGSGSDFLLSGTLLNICLLHKGKGKWMWNAVQNLGLVLFSPYFSRYASVLSFFPSSPCVTAAEWCDPLLSLLYFEELIFSSNWPGASSLPITAGQNINFGNSAACSAIWKEQGGDSWQLGEH